MSVTPPNRAWLFNDTLHVIFETMDIDRHAIWFKEALADFKAGEALLVEEYNDHDTVMIE